MSTISRQTLSDKEKILLLSLLASHLMNIWAIVDKLEKGRPLSDANVQDILAQRVAVDKIMNVLWSNGFELF